MYHPQSRRSRVAALVLGLLLAAAGCSASPQPAGSPTPNPAPVTARALAALIEEHFGVGSGAYSGERYDVSTVGVVAYPAAPGVPARSVMLKYGEGPSWAQDASSCRDAAMATPSVQCMSRDDVHLGWERGTDIVWVASSRSKGVVVAGLEGMKLPEHPLADQLPDDLTKLVALAKDPRADAVTVAGQLSPTTAWTDDPACTSARLAPRATVPGPSGEPAEPATPQAFVALIAERVSGTCGFGASYSDDPRVWGTLYLDAGDTERVTAMVTTAKVGCGGMDACEKRGNLTIAWQFDVPEEYPATVVVSRPIAGGQLVITHTSMTASPKGRTFPVPLDALMALASDDRFGFTIDPALNRAGAASALCWRLVTPTGG